MKKRRRLLVALFALLIGIGAIVTAVVVLTGPPALTPAQIAARAQRLLLAQETKAVNRATRLVAAQLPKTEGAPAPVSPTSLFVRPLRAHQVFGFVPYWELGALTSSDFDAASDLVYASVCVAADGSISNTPGDCHLGVSDLGGPAFASFIASARLANDRVLLSVSAADDAVIERLDRDPAAHAARLGAALEAIVAAHGFAGVNIDIEGTKAADAGAFATFVGDLVGRLRAADPTGAIVLDAYASSAAGGSFFNLRRLAPLVDEVFLMAYDMNDPSIASASSPLKSPTLGYSVVQSLMQYEKVIPARKIVLGMPFYGNDFETSSAAPRSLAKNAAPEAFSYDAIVKAGKTARWDLASDTPYSTFQRAGSWHEIWFDDPVSLALKTALAANFHTAGVGAWAFGMEGSADGLLAALDGGAAPLRAPLAPPPSTTVPVS